MSEQDIRDTWQIKVDLAANPHVEYWERRLAQASATCHAYVAAGNLSGSLIWGKAVGDILARLQKQEFL